MYDIDKKSIINDESKNPLVALAMSVEILVNSEDLGFKIQRLEPMLISCVAFAVYRVENKRKHHLGMIGIKRDCIKTYIQEPPLSYRYFDVDKILAIEAIYPFLSAIRERLINLDEYAESLVHDILKYPYSNSILSMRIQNVRRDIELQKLEDKKFLKGTVAFSLLAIMALIFRDKLPLALILIICTINIIGYALYIYFQLNVKKFEDRLNKLKEEHERSKEVGDSYVK
jgi:hypothetical protein